MQSYQFHDTKLSEFTLIRLPEGSLELVSKALGKALSRQIQNGSKISKKNFTIFSLL
jgi:flagella basal body P-ring formation protein FlgA